jgi:hypothetical protein
MTNDDAFVSDEELRRLIEANAAAIAARGRAEAFVRDIRERAAAVAAELRHCLSAGDIADALPVARIAAEFEWLAHADPIAMAEYETRVEGCYWPANEFDGEADA